VALKSSLPFLLFYDKIRKKLLAFVERIRRIHDGNLFKFHYHKPVHL